jgi:hypothetical protein
MALTHMGTGAKWSWFKSGNPDSVKDLRTSQAWRDASTVQDQLIDEEHAAHGPLNATFLLIMNCRGPDELNGEITVAGVYIGLDELVTLSSPSRTGQYRPALLPTATPPRSTPASFARYWVICQV